jgi:hypothetical protein
MQDFLVYIIVLGAAAYLARMLWSAASGQKSGCNSCGSSCAANKPSSDKQSNQQSTPAPAQLVQIDLGKLNSKR